METNATAIINAAHELLACFDSECLERLAELSYAIVDPDGTGDEDDAVEAAYHDVEGAIMVAFLGLLNAKPAEDPTTVWTVMVTDADGGTTVSVFGSEEAALEGATTAVRLFGFAGEVTFVDFEDDAWEWVEDDGDDRYVRIDRQTVR